LDERGQELETELARRVSSILENERHSHKHQLADLERELVKVNKERAERVV